MEHLYPLLQACDLAELRLACLDEGLLLLFLPILVYVKNPYKRNK